MSQIDSITCGNSVSEEPGVRFIHDSSGIRESVIISIEQYLEYRRLKGAKAFIVGRIAEAAEILSDLCADEESAWNADSVAVIEMATPTGNDESEETANLSVRNGDLSRSNAPLVASNEKLFAFYTKGVYATAIELDGNFVVLCGSEAVSNQHEAPSLPDAYRQRRAELVLDGSLVPESRSNGREYYRFTRNVSFDNRTMPACVVAGNSRTGKQCSWKPIGT